MYEPPQIISFPVAPPKGMQSRRSARNAIAVLIDHEGKVLAARMGTESSDTASAMMLSLVRAKYRPASLNGIPVPALITMGTNPPAQ